MCGLGLKEFGKLWKHHTSVHIKELTTKISISLLQLQMMRIVMFPQIEIRSCLRKGEKKSNIDKAIPVRRDTSPDIDMTMEERQRNTRTNSKRSVTWKRCNT